MLHKREHSRGIIIYCECTERERSAGYQIYSQEELIGLISANKHLERVEKIDECQLVTDIEARAKVVMLPAYQYLWGDMQRTGTCARH